MPDLWTPTAGAPVWVDGERPAVVVSPGLVLRLAYCRFPAGQHGNIAWARLTPRTR